MVEGSASIVINRPASEVFDAIADVTRMGEWSPVCTTAVWVDDAQNSFVGTNDNGSFTWQTTCRVDVAETGREFTFVNRGMNGDEELVRWSYTFEPVDGGTLLTESWEVLPEYEPSMTRLMPDMDLQEYLDGVKPVTQAGMATTIANVKAAAER